MEENLYFENVDATRADRSFNYPNANPANAKVSKVQGKSEGLKLTLKVMPNDTIEISAKAFYNIDNTFPGASVNVAPIVGAALAAMTNPVGTLLGETSQITNTTGAVSSNSTALSNLPEENNQNNAPQPKSGINFVLYNSSFDVVEENTGYLPVDDHINAIQNLATDKLVMKDAGFLEIFVNNDAQTPVYYDNMMVTMATGTAMEINAYYPSGKILSNFTTNNWMYAPQYNHYKYNAKERQTELGLEWLDYGARMMDPVIGGRFWTPDPLAEKYYSISPYAYCANNPINFIDPDGMTIVGDTLAVSRLESEAQNGIDSEQRLQARLQSRINKRSDQGKGTDRLERRMGRSGFRESHYKSTINEIGKLRSSNNIYNVNTNYNSSYSDGNIEYVSTDAQGNHTLNINVSSSYAKAGGLAHELVHGYQFESGSIDFRSNGLPGILYDISDEMAAFARQLVFAKNSQMYSVTSSYVRGLTNRNGEPIYGNLPSGPLSVISTYSDISIGYYRMPSIYRTPYKQLGFQYIYNRR